jgi:hypothetical protein
MTGKPSGTLQKGTGIKNAVMNVLKHENDNLWCGMKYWGLSRYDGNILRHFLNKSEGVGCQILSRILWTVMISIQH